MGQITPKALVVGSVNMDLIVPVKAFPRPGETCTGGALTLAAGGKGANQAAALARLEAETYFLGAVGRDEFGRQLLQGLQQDGVDVSLVKRIDHVATGVALILLQQDGQNSIIVSPGANGLLTPDDLLGCAAKLPSMDIVLVQLEIPQDTVREAALLGKAMNALCVLDAGPPRSLPSEILTLFDLVSPNETETECLTGIRPVDLDSAAEAAQVFRQQGCDKVVLKLGAFGAYYMDGDEEGYIPAYPISAVDTTAAGDAFTAALSLRLAQGATMEEAVAYGAAAGACAALVLGARPSMPALERLKCFLHGDE